ncbi:MAG TPA: methyltransferase domain-containing protein [Ilumatobacteraceae bacterium]|nr:methyltransferase domain-containing protein [Ilumatobacteraceae bacterium]
MPDAWDPGQYEKFAAERARPFWDLVALVEDRPLERAVDLGCGTGALTAELTRRRSVGAMLGIDSSPNMLAQAAAHAGPHLRFEAGDIATWTGRGDVDLVLSNAALQWVPDHVGVVTRWWAALRPGGQLAVQIPANADHASHRVAAEVAASEPFRSAMGGAPPADQVAVNVLAPEQYAILLDHLGAARQHVRLQVYGHVLERSADVVEWVKGTSLTRFTNILPAALHDEFLATYTERLLARIGDHAPYFYPFKRILFWGRKQA